MAFLLASRNDTVEPSGLILTAAEACRQRTRAAAARRAAQSAATAFLSRRRRPGASA